MTGGEEDAVRFVTDWDHIRLKDDPAYFGVKRIREWRNEDRSRVVLVSWNDAD